MSGALSHLTVLDLSRVLAGPWATQVLADLGAEVIKIERPGAGDDTRHWGPPYLRDPQGFETSESAYYLAANRNKRSVALDIGTPQGQAIVRDLAAECDVVVENFKVGTLRRYGLDYETIHSVAPRIVYCSITGFGQTGPYAERAGYDLLIQGLGGLMSITGRADGEEGAGPIKSGVGVTDLMTGLYATIAILAALHHRDRTGEGQCIDASLLDVQVAMLANQAMNFLTTRRTPRRIGNAHPSIVPYQDFPTADGYMILAIGSDAQFAKFCEVAGHGELARDERFRTNAARVEHRTELLRLLHAIVRKRSTIEWVTLLEKQGVPCGPINDLAAVFADPQVRARELELSLPHPCGAAPGVASPIRLNRTPVEYRWSAPMLGQHTRQVLRDRLHLGEADLARLEYEGVIADVAQKRSV